MTPAQTAPTAVALASLENGVAADRTRHRRWSTAGDLIMLGRRSPEQVLRRAFPAVRVVLADGERLVRAGLRRLLEAARDIEVAGEAASGVEAVALVGRIRPDVVLMQARLPDLDGLQATRRITARPELAHVQVLIVGQEERDEEVLGALRAGAAGFVAMDAPPAELVRAVRVLAAGGVRLSPSVTRRLVEQFADRPAAPRPAPERFARLTAREREVAALVAAGLSNDEIAQQLVLSPTTAKTHVSRAMIKLGVSDRAKLVALAYQTGFAHTAHDDGPGAETDRQPTGEPARGSGIHERISDGAVDPSVLSRITARQRDAPDPSGA